MRRLAAASSTNVHASESNAILMIRAFGLELSPRWAELFRLQTTTQPNMETDPRLPPISVFSQNPDAQTLADQPVANDDADDATAEEATAGPSTEAAAAEPSTSRQTATAEPSTTAARGGSDSTQDNELPVHRRLLKRRRNAAQRIDSDDSDGGGRPSGDFPVTTLGERSWVRVTFARLREILADLECPVCKTPYHPHFEQCPMGHIHCRPCLAKLSQCSICRTTIPHIKAQAVTVNKLIEKIPIPCIYQMCLETRPMSQIDNHMKNCRHRHLACPMCQGKDDRYGTDASLFLHFATTHKNVHIARVEDEGAVSMKFLQKCAGRNPNIPYTQAFVQYCKSTRVPFFISLFFGGNNSQQLKFFVLGMCNQYVLNNKAITITVRHPDGRARHRTFVEMAKASVYTAGKPESSYIFSLDREDMTSFKSGPNKGGWYLAFSARTLNGDVRRADNEHVLAEAPVITVDSSA